MFIDESGDAGMKLDKGSKPFFTVALLLFETPAAAGEAEKRIAALRRALRFHPGFEFHFNKLRQDFREEFLQAVAPVEFSYFTATIDKAALAPDVFRTAADLYRHACGLALESARPYLRQATVIIDSREDRTFQAELSTYLFRLANAESERKVLRKIKTQTSASNSLLQMADMVCGSIARFWSDRSKGQVFRKLLSRHEMACQIWPRAGMENPGSIL